MAGLTDIDNEPPRPWPKGIILRVSDLMARFEQETQGYRFEGSDYEEVLRQIFDLLLNFGPNAAASYARLPDTSRLMGELDLPVDSPRRAGLNFACMNLAHGIQDRIDEYQIWREHARGVDCPYYFGGFINRDVLLDHMPY